MGTDKALLDIDGRPLLERVLQAARPLGLPLFLVAPSRPAYAAFGLPLIEDRAPGRGPVGGLDTALNHLADTEADSVLLLACDLPHLSSDFLRFLLESFVEGDALVPVDDHGPQPLCAIYRTSAAPTVQAALADDRLSLRRLLNQLETVYLPKEKWQAFDPHGRLLDNLNTPEDYSRAGLP